MRIALVASLVSPIRGAEANGPHAVIIDLARGLSARGHLTTIYAASGSEVDHAGALREIEVDPIAQQAAIKTNGQRASAKPLTALEEGFERLFEAVSEDLPDAVSQHAFDAAAIRLAERLPVIHTLHLPPIDEAVVDAARATRRPLAAVSEFGLRQWQRFGVRDLRVLRNGVPVPDEPGILTRVRNVALICGRISPEKGTHVAVRAARHARLEPMVVGEVYDQPYFESSVSPLLRPGDYVGAVPRAVVSSLMAESRVLLMPIDWDEPFGLVAAEAQMRGCPVVGYRRGALPEVVIDGLGGCLVDPDDEDALVDAIGRSGTLDRERIRSWARDNLGVERMVDDHERVLTQVASREATPPRRAATAPGTS